MNLIHAVILSIVEGITEFLPVSSTGHLVLVSKLLAIPTTDFSKSFDIVIQLGAILAVVSLYWKTIIRKPKTIIPVMAAFMPTAIVGFILYKFIKGVLLSDTPVIIGSLAVGGIILLLIDRFIKKSQFSDITRMSFRHAIIIGLGQSLAVVPGVSRSAATIVTALLLGWDKASAVEFSFLLAVPTIAAAAGLDAVKNVHALTTNLPLLAVGLVGSWITALVAVRAFVGFVKTHSFAAFGWYRLIAAAMFWFLIRV